MITWRSLRGFSADRTEVSPGGPRLQVLEIDTEDGVLTVLASAAAVSELLGGVRRWSDRWRRARSPLGLFGRRRRRSAGRVA